MEEIRVRSLQNILSKLEHSLVCDADLVQEKHLHIRLLEWFNFSSCPHQELVLGLILRLSQVLVFENYFRFLEILDQKSVCKFVNMSFSVVFGCLDILLFLLIWLNRLTIYLPFV